MVASFSALFKRLGRQGSPFWEEEAHDGAILGTTLHINLNFFFAYFQVLNLIFLVLKFVNGNFSDTGPLNVFLTINSIEMGAFV